MNVVDDIFDDVNISQSHSKQSKQQMVFQNQNKNNALDKLDWLQGHLRSRWPSLGKL